MRTAISTVASSKSSNFSPSSSYTRGCGWGGAHFSRDRKCVDRSECVWCYDRLGAHPGGVKLVNLTASHLARKMARRDKRHRRSGRPVVEHDIQKTRFIKNLKRGRPACEATAEGCTPEEMERWAGIS